MRALLSAGIVSLILAYTLSQFYRAFLAVLTPVLQAELGAAPDDLAIQMQVKDLFDPRWLLNPAKVFPLAASQPHRDRAAAE